MNSDLDEDQKRYEKLLHSIIDGGNDMPEVKHLLGYLQRQLKKTCLWAGLGQETGDKLVRAAFGVIVKHGNLTFKFENCMKSVYGKEYSEIEMTKTLKTLLKKWEAASRMRKWLVNKRKEIDELAEQKGIVQQPKQSVIQEKQQKEAFIEVKKETEQKREKTE